MGENSLNAQLYVDGKPVPLNPSSPAEQRTPVSTMSAAQCLKEGAIARNDENMAAAISTIASLRSETAQRVCQSLSEDAKNLNLPDSAKFTGPKVSEACKKFDTGPNSP